MIQWAQRIPHCKAIIVLEETEARTYPCHSHPFRFSHSAAQCYMPSVGVKERERGGGGAADSGQITLFKKF